MEQDLHHDILVHLLEPFSSYFRVRVSGAENSEEDDLHQLVFVVCLVSPTGHVHSHVEGALSTVDLLQGKGLQSITA